jgi:PRTRC genetic system protein E
MAITNFFSQLAALEFTGSLNMTLKKDGDSLTVSLLLQNPACGDSAKNHIPPLILKGTAKELGEGFFPAITQPVEATSQLLTNMEQFLKGQEAARKNAAMEKKKTEGAATAKADTTDPKEKKYAAAMAQVDALEAEGKYRDAWVKVPQPSDYPERAEQLRRRRESLSRQFEPDLFGVAQPKTNETEPKTENHATDQTDAEGIFDERENR